MSQNDLTKIESIFVILSLFNEDFHRMTKILDDGQTHEPLVSISNLNN